MNLVINVGLPGAGKSTFTSRNFPEYTLIEKVNMQQFDKTRQQILGAQKGIIISKDAIGGQKRESKQAILVRTALEAGKSVVVDNCNVKLSERAAIISQGQAYRARIVCYHFDSDSDACIERNRQREGKAQVPKVAIHLKNKLFEPPTYAEGFDEVIRVLTVPPSAFRLETVPEE